MQAVRSILVVLDPDHAHSRALIRAKLIAGVTGARLHLLLQPPVVAEQVALVAVGRTQIEQARFQRMQEARAADGGLAVELPLRS